MKPIRERRNRIETESTHEKKHVASSDNTFDLEKIKSKSGIIKKRKIRSLKVLVITAVIGFTTITTSCNSYNKKIENAEKDALSAEQSLEKERAEYLAEVENYKVETSERIKSNKQYLGKLNARIDSEKQEVKAAYQKQITELEQKNADLQKRMDNYKADTKENWHSFKSEFNQDMDELGAALKNFTSKD